MRPSAFQLEVAETLRRMGLFPKVEAISTDGYFSIDVALHWQGWPVAIEVNGPHHYTKTLPYQILGPSSWKNRRLAARGLKVVNVEWFKWGELDSHVDRVAFMMRKLQQHVLYADALGQPPAKL